MNENMNINSQTSNSTVTGAGNVMIGIGANGFTQVKIKKKQTQQQLQQIYLDIFKMFSSDGLYIKATEFVGLGKMLKVHPVIISFDQFKKVLLRSPEYWNSKKDLKYLNSEVISATFSPTDFIRAFKIIAKIGYRNIDETNQNKFIILTQYLRKQLAALQQKREKSQNIGLSGNQSMIISSGMAMVNNQIGIGSSGALVDMNSDSRSVKTAYEGTQKFNNAMAQSQNFQMNSYQNRIATSPGNAYFESSNQPYSQTPSQLDQSIHQEKRLSGIDLPSQNLGHQVLSNEYRQNYHQQHSTLIAAGINTAALTGGGVRLNSSSQGLNTITAAASQWRTCNSEIKSEISSRAFSSAVRTSQGKGTKGLIIPKSLLRKKFKQQPFMSVNNYLSYKTSANVQAGVIKIPKGSLKGQIYSASETRKSYTSQNYQNKQLKDTRNQSPHLIQSIPLDQNIFLGNQRYNNNSHFQDLQEQVGETLSHQNLNTISASNTTTSAAAKNSKNGQNFINPHHQASQSINFTASLSGQNPSSQSYSANLVQQQRPQLVSQKMNRTIDHSGVNIQNNNQLSDAQLRQSQLNPLSTIEIGSVSNNGGDNGALESARSNRSEQQQSFRIRKFSRSLSRHSNSSSAHSFRSAQPNPLNNENSYIGDYKDDIEIDDAPQEAGVDSRRIIANKIDKKKRIEGPSNDNTLNKNDILRKSIDFQDIRLNDPLDKQIPNVNGKFNLKDGAVSSLITKQNRNKEIGSSQTQKTQQEEQMISLKEYRKLESHTKRYKNQRDQLIKLVSSMKKTFFSFAENQKNIQGNFSVTKDMLKSLKVDQTAETAEKFETGHSVHKEDTHFTDQNKNSKDQRIKELEEEIKRLKELQQIQNI